MQFQSNKPAVNYKNKGRQMPRQKENQWCSAPLFESDFVIKKINHRDITANDIRIP